MSINYVWPVRGGEWKASCTAPHLFSFENLYHNYLKCRSNKRNTINALKFEANAEENLFRLSEELQNMTYRPSRSICFVVERPKMREIIAADFRDRVVHHLLVGQLENIYESVFIHDSYACRVDKGIHRAVERVQKFIRKGGANGNKRLYSLHLDIRNFFMTIDKEILYRMLEKKIKKNGEEYAGPLLWLAGIIVFHNPVDDAVIKGKKALIPYLPPQKSLFHAEEGKGLPIGNLTSQFFANVYLNALDQHIKHMLKCRFYVRYCDDLLLLDGSLEKLEAIREKIRVFVERELLLNLNEKHGRVTTVMNGIDCLGYIVRPDYTLTRRRVVNNLKQRLDWFEKRLVADDNKDFHKISPSPSLSKRGEPKLLPKVGTVIPPLEKGDKVGFMSYAMTTVLSYDYALIERLRAVVASYWGHLKRANTYWLRKALLKRYWFLEEFFSGDANMPVLTCKFRAEFPDVKSQYCYYAAHHKKCAVFFHVGSFYEIYDNEAWARRMALKQLKKNKRGAQYGFPVKLKSKYANILLAEGRSVVVVQETGNYNGRLKERLPVMKITKGVCHG